MDNHIKKKGSDRPNKRGGVTSRGAPAPATLRVAGGGGGSRKGDLESCRDGTYGDTVLTPRDNHEHPSMTDSKQVLKVELQRLYMTKENEKIVMEALRNIHGDDFQLQDKSSYRDQGNHLSKHYWMSRGTLIVQGGIDYSNQRPKLPGKCQINDYALKKLESYGFHTNHCLEALTARDGDTGLAQELLISVYFSLDLAPHITSEATSIEPLSEALLDARLEEKEALQAIYDTGFKERIPNKVWVVRLELPILAAACDKPENKVVHKPSNKAVCKFYLKGNCKYSYKCKNSHDGASFDKKVDDAHLKVPGENSKEFELEIRFPEGCKYPSEPALICVTAINPKYPTDMCLKLMQRLQKEALALAQDGFPAVFSLVGILENEAEIRDIVHHPRPGPKASQPLIPVGELEENGTTSEAERQKLQTNNASATGSYHRQSRQQSSSEVIKENERLRQRFKEKLKMNEYQKMQRTRKNLPAWDYRERILSALEGHQVVVVSGATGCGKSTQVPQYLLDEWLGSDKWDSGIHREIICTQPRRLSAIGVAERVADERAEKIGQSVGYQIRLESKMSSSTRLLFCTTGILLRRLESDSELSNVSHVIVDEVHERSEESDFLLMIIRDLLPSRPDLKIILMSATLNADLFSDYFGGVPVLEIPGRTFPVEQYFLEDALEHTEFAMEENSPYARHIKTNNLGMKKGVFDSLDDAADDMELEVAMTGDNFKPAHDKTPDEKLSVPQLFHRYEQFSKKTCKALALMDPEKINYDLIETTLLWIVNGDHGYPRTGSILIFLPGMAEITTLHDQLKDHQIFGQRRGDFLLVPLHSALSSEEQALVFKKPKPGVRKIVISTNIAETSITIDDCVFVIDVGKMKEKRYDPNKNMESLELCWVSQANALQRRGRAGRVMPGVCIHLFTKHRYEWQFMKQPIPELQRVPLEQLVLRIKVLKLFEGREPWEVLSCTLEPPSDESVSTAICRLQDVGALDENTALTPLGHHLAALPVDVRIGKLMLMGAIFCCVDSALTMAACLSFKSPFVSPFSKREEADAKRQQFAIANSDQLTALRAYKAWLKAREHSSMAGYAFAQENYLSSRTLSTIVETKQQLLELLASIGFVPGANFEAGKLRRAAKMGKDQTLMATGTRLNSNNDNTKLLASILCAALYPNVVKVLSPQKSFSQKAGGAVPRIPKPEELRFKTKEDGYVAIHPSSSNYQVGLYSSPYLVFHEKIKTSRVFIRECSMVPALALVLLTGSSLHVELHQGTSVIALEGGWIRLGVDSHPIAEMLKTIREELMLLLDQKIREPGLDLQAEQRSQYVITAIVKLLSTE